MRKLFTKKLCLGLAMSMLIMFGAQAQTSISGSIVDSNTKEQLLGASVLVKGKVLGTISDLDGNFKLSITSNPPLTLVISMVGYSSFEIDITDSQVDGLEIELEESAMLGQEVVVSASRVEENIMQSPVSIEKMDILAVQNTASDDYYKSMANLKGVDVTTSSINFQIVNARGFSSTGNTRFIQLTDGMDTQAPALNFPIGNLNGPSRLDVESLELIPGASSALYGPNAFNGVLLVNSKNAFEYQGLSAGVKMGVNHVGADADQGAAPLYDVAIRYAKAFNNKFAFKVNASYMKASDWHGTSALDRNPTPEGFSHNPGADRLNYMGDEAIINLGFLSYAARAAYASQGTAADNASYQSLRGALNGITGSALPIGYNVTQYLDYVPNQNVARTAYKEADLINYNAENYKFNTGLYYRINDNIEASYLLNYGGGTSIYTGAQRYSLSNFSITQHRLQLRGDNFYVKAYTTIENSGDSYITEFLGNVVNESFASNNLWFASYTAHYLSYLGGNNLSGGTTGLGMTPDQLASSPLTAAQQEAAHIYARNQSDALRPEAGSDNFNTAKSNGLVSGVVPDGPKFADKSKMNHFEGQYDFKNEVHFMNLMVGASYRVFDLRSEGTIFALDSIDGIQINEFGAYLQGSKKVAQDKLNLLTSLRFDKNQNFGGQFNPRFSAVYTEGDHNFRGSFQTGFRNPTTQGQYINLDIISTRLLGGLPEAHGQYGLNENTYTIGSVNAFTNAVYAGGDLAESAEEHLVVSSFTLVKPEKVKSIEVGYKGLIKNKLMIDAVYYYNIYSDFITQIQMRKASADVFADPENPSAEAASSLISGSSDNTFQVYTNIDNQVSSQGAAIGLNYSMLNNFALSANYNWNVLNEDLAAQGYLNEFNTPEHKMNLSFSNRKLTENIGFTVSWRWQDAFRWESSFGQGEVSAYNTLDAQVSYKMSSLKSIVKLGASNLLNKKYNMNLGGPNIGGLYYISVTFDQFSN